MKTPELWEIDAYEKAKRQQLCTGAMMRSWSPHFRAQALWRQYVIKWRAAKLEEDSG